VYQDWCYELIFLEEYCISTKKVLMKVQLFVVVVRKNYLNLFMNCKC